MLVQSVKLQATTTKRKSLVIIFKHISWNFTQNADLQRYKVEFHVHVLSTEDKGRQSMKRDTINLKCYIASKACMADNGIEIIRKKLVGTTTHEY